MPPAYSHRGPEDIAPTQLYLGCGLDLGGKLFLGFRSFQVLHVVQGNDYQGTVGEVGVVDSSLEADNGLTWVRVSFLSPWTDF